VKNDSQPWERRGPDDHKKKRGRSEGEAPQASKEGQQKTQRAKHLGEGGGKEIYLT